MSASWRLGILGLTPKRWSGWKFSKKAPLDLDLVTFGEIELRGSFGHSAASWEKAIGLLGDGKGKA